MRGKYKSTLQTGYSRRSFLQSAGLALAGLSVVEFHSIAEGAAQKLPNIIVILADDMGYGDLNCENSESKIPTPNLDKLAEQGMRFRDAHTPSSVCSPTRYGLLTGRYAWRTRMKKGVLGQYCAPLINKDRETLASVLKEKGYETACVGKWHLGMQWGTKDPGDRLPRLRISKFDP